MKSLEPLFCRFALTIAIAAGGWTLATPVVEAQGGITVNIPGTLAAGPDYATDVIGDAWDMSNGDDIAVDPAQRTGWSSLGFTGGRLDGITAAVGGSVNGSNVSILQRAYWGIINPGRTGARYSIDSTKYTKLAFKMGSTRNDQFPRIFWFQEDLGEPAGAGGGWRYIDACSPCNPSPVGDHIFVVDLTQNLGGGTPWTAAAVRGLSMYPNSSAVGYEVAFDWIRLTAGDGQASAAKQTITWSGGTGAATIQVTDAAGTSFTVASNVAGTSYDWNYGVLPPGMYTVRVIRGASSGTSAVRINTPPTLQITDPDAAGGEDFATTVLGNPWDMSDAADVGAVAEDHLISRSFGGGQFHGISDGTPVAYSGAIPVGDPIVYPLTNNGVVNTSRYRYLTYRLQVDGGYDLGRGSVARVFWGSVAGSPYNVTVSKDIIVWPGMNTYTIDLASLSTAADGGIVATEGAHQLWTAANVRYLRLDPHEFAEQRGFHFDDVKLAALDETKGNNFTIRFNGSDADGDAVQVALYYDTDQNPANGRTLITESLPLAAGQWVWNTSAVPSGVYYIYAVANDGLNSHGTYAGGPVRVSSSAPQPNPQMSLDGPADGSTVMSPFQVSGWAVDLGAPSGTGVDAVHVYAYPNPGSGQAPLFLGLATYGQARPDVGALTGAQFTPSGYSIPVGTLPPGRYQIAVFAHSVLSGAFQLRTTTITLTAPPARLTVDTPGAGATVAQPFVISGWSIDPAAPSGPGVDAIHVWAYPNPGSGAEPVFVGAATYGVSRPDIGAIFGPRFNNSGYNLTVRGLAPGPYQFAVFSHSTATGTFNMQKTVNLTVQAGARLSIDLPSPGPVARAFTIAGWALDLNAPSGTGVDAIHVWAYKDPGSGTPPQFVGVAAYGATRTDVGAYFGSAQFNQSGYNLAVSGLTPGTYDLVVFAHSTVSNAFDNWRTVRVVVP